LNFNRKHIEDKSRVPEVELDKLDEFELDAKEGWDKLNVEDLKRLDQRYKNKTLLLKLSFTVLFFSTFVISIIIYEAYNKEISTVEKTGVIQKNKYNLENNFQAVKLPRKNLVLIPQH